MDQRKALDDVTEANMEDVAELLDFQKRQMGCFCYYFQNKAYLQAKFNYKKLGINIPTEKRYKKTL